MALHTKQDTTDGDDIAENYRELRDSIEETTETMAALTEQMGRLTDRLDDFSATTDRLAGGDTQPIEANSIGAD